MGRFRAEICDNPQVPEPAEIAAIFREALPRVYGFILVRVAGNQAIAEDLTSETFLAFTAGWPRDRERVPDPIAWLIGVARNKVLAFYRAETARSHQLIDWSDGAERIPEIDAELDRIADRDELFRLLSLLPTEQQIVLLLRYLDGYNVRETAALIGKSEHAIESILARAKRTIRVAITASEEINP